MKLHRLLILSGLLMGAAPGIAYAGCAASCVNCRYEAAGNYFYCGDSAVKGVRPRVAASAQPGGGVAQKGGSPVGSNARTSGPSVGPRAPVAHKESIEVASVKSRRERATTGVVDKPKQQP